MVNDEIANVLDEYKKVLKVLLKLKNQKRIAVDVLFKAYPMIPLSG
jgi:hypothetical protein